MDIKIFSHHDTINVNDATSVNGDEKEKLDFCSLVNGTKLPRAQRCRGKLYSVTVLERNTTRCFVMSRPHLSTYPVISEGQEGMVQQATDFAKS